ncbi:ATP--cob(I)alamin adenosyltransferase [Zobellella sp. DQSA1]|uniref:ATP--cob(I)alamin adenosyltransferase n=1 Tax=Zobellella sp. DQSA1 TaxID=3342386 RepID=UPI0035C0A8C1
MNYKKPKDRREWCYPFIYEQQPLCDYEIATDELCSRVGLVLALLPEALARVEADLDWLQPRIYHLNGSVRGRNGIFETDLDGLKERYDWYREQVADRVSGFVLPRGSRLVAELHLCRCGAKKVVRHLVQLEQAGLGYENTLPRFANLLANFFFVLTVFIKQEQGEEEVPYISINY